MDFSDTLLAELCNVPPQSTSLGAPDPSSEGVHKLSDDVLFKVISEGKNNMPSFKDELSKDEIRAVITHVRTFAKKQ